MIVTAVKTPPRAAPILGLSAGIGLLPGIAFAHASERMVILTLPTGYYILGAALTVALTAILTLILPRFSGLSPRPIMTLSAERRTAWGGWLATLALFVLLAVGFFGSHDPFRNLLPLTIWTALWVWLTMLTAIVGNLWPAIDPWRAPVRWLRQRIGRQGGIGLARLGHWPAVAGYFAFAWFEIVSLAPDAPERLAVVAFGYWALILALAVAEGEAWLAKGEFLTVYFGFIARIAPVWVEEREAGRTVMAGFPGAQIMTMAPLSASAIAFVTLLLASVSFDGLSETFWWIVRLGINPLEFPGRSAVQWQNTFGLAMTWGLMAATILTAIILGVRLGGASHPGAAIGPMMLSFLPIAAGYHIAHYLIQSLTVGQYLIAALSDPFGSGWDIFGLGPHWVSFGFLSRAGPVHAIWNVQFAIILGAHVLAVILSHRLGGLIGNRAGFRAHLPLTVLMVLYTMLGLWLLSAPTAG